MSDRLKVTMLGEFKLEKDSSVLSDSNNRMKKVWLLLAYLIYSRNSHTTQDHYIALLRDAGDHEIDDPSGRLKALFYRARNMLNQLDESAGHQWIIRKDGQYTWNPDLEMSLDIDDFERINKEAEKETDPDRKLSLQLQAFHLYQGDFLPKLSMEPWVMLISVYYHQMYLNLTFQILTALESDAQYDRVISVAERALVIEPYSEELYQFLMKAQLASGDRTGLQANYEKMSELLFSAFGVMPSEESRKIYRDSLRETNDTALHITSVRDNLQETTGIHGAMYCEYDFFRFLYQVQSRSIVRSGNTIHSALFSLHGRNEKELARRSLDNAMDNLQEILINQLRQGDVITKCSISQLLIMLPQANFENSLSVCDRLVKAFYRKYPHSPVEIRCSVHPLEPAAPSSLHPVT